MRRNINITYLVHNNQVYGLTKGQTSPTSELGYISKTTPLGALIPPMSPLLLAIASNCSFVARGFSGETEHLTRLIKEGISHKGFALIDILQNCVSFNRVNTFQWYSKRVYKINDEPGYDPNDRMLAITRAQEWGERIPIGILYRTERPTLDEQEPTIKEVSLVKQKIDQASFVTVLAQFK
jgi:2-oxoglutarate ferredoxin oxidoreductase subunit beta